ncbi:MAG: hypothetical protein D6753_10715 [Planctomycetota bacterium]|nr:MAG: hypothetical protein D6753_10715 [Planctomycetota bacterium]
MNKKRLMLIFAALLGIAAFGGVWSMFSTEDPTERELEFALKFLQEGRYDVAGRMARDLASAVEPDSDSAWRFLAGVAELRQVEGELGTPRARKAVLRAIEHLEKAQEIGWPPGYRAEGRFYLGYCYYLTNRWQDAVEQLQGLPQAWPEGRSQVWRLLVRAYLRLDPPDLDSATRELEAWSSVPGLSRDEEAELALERAVLEYTRGDYPAADRILSEIPVGTSVQPEAQLWRGRLRLAQVTEGAIPPTQVQATLAEAEEILRKLKTLPSTPEAIRRHAMFLSGRCMRLQGREREALGTFSSLRQTAPRSVEAVAAGVEESEILMQTDDYPQVVDILHSLLVNLEDIGLYDDFWLPRKVLKKRLMDVGRALRDRGDYAHALQHAKNLAIAFPLGDSLQLQAEILESWALAMENEPPPPDTESQHWRQQVAQRFRQAAETFERWTQVEWADPNYTENLWRAVVNYQRANDIPRANELLRKYLLYEDRSKRPRAFLALGKNLMSQAKWEEALVPLQRCLVDYPEHPISHEARLYAARAKVELRELDDAIDLLEENLYDHQLRPNNLTWQDSLFELGRVLYQYGDQILLEMRLNPAIDVAAQRRRLQQCQELFLQAVEKLSEVALRWNEGARHYQARYLVADSYLQAAETPTQLLRLDPDLLAANKRKLLQNRRELLDKALLEFERLERDLTLNVDRLDNAEWAVTLLRNVYFGQADTLFEQGRFEEAVAAYQNVTARFMNQPESLEALVQIAACYGRLGRDEDARHVLATARQVLARIPPEHDNRFVQVTRGSREDWKRLINQMGGWY